MIWTWYERNPSKLIKARAGTGFFIPGYPTTPGGNSINDKSTNDKK